MKENASSRNLRNLLAMASALPVARLASSDSWRSIGQMAVERGFPFVEILLRSEFAESGVRQLRQNFPQLAIGVGTVLSVDDLKLAQDWGADFAVSPGCLEPLLAYAASQDFPYLPGVSNASDIMLAASYGFPIVKIFPAAALGAAYIRNLEGPFPWMQAVVSGGIEGHNAAEFSELNSVICVSGSWLLEGPTSKGGPSSGWA